MKFILLNDQKGSVLLDSRSWRVRLAVVMLAIGLIGTGVLASFFYDRMVTDRAQQEALIGWQQSLDDQFNLVNDTRAHTQAQLFALTASVAELEARLLRLDALGERVATDANLDNGEFDFSRKPALGGPSMTVADKQNTQNTGPQSVREQMLHLDSALERLLLQIADREQQLFLLDQQLQAKNSLSNAFIAGRPIKKGWLSSYYGKRIDPFTAKEAWHSGVDFAGKLGSDIIAVAGGVVTWSGERYGYGLMVEVNHGDGFVTRYAHNKENLVEVGDVVTKGQALAKMGSSGRSTGPHVHFEVLRHGKMVDPTRYINRQSL